MLRTDMALRTAAMGCRVQSSISTPCAYHTTTSSSTSSSTNQNTLCISTRRSVGVKSLKHKSLLPSARCSSTSTTKASSSGPDMSPNPSVTVLDWNTFFKLRKTRRRLQLGSSVGTSAIGLVTGAQALMMSDMDGILGQLPLDPFISLGLITFSCGGVGWLLGPIVGTGIFNTMNSKTKGEMIVKEKEFYDRVRKYRVDPSASSMANPVPDYYGEKISSVQGYRQWLKDQRAFNKKREQFVK